MDKFFLFLTLICLIGVIVALSLNSDEWLLICIALAALFVMRGARD